MQKRRRGGTELGRDRRRAARIHNLFRRIKFGLPVAPSDISIWPVRASATQFSRRDSADFPRCQPPRAFTDGISRLFGVAALS